MIKKHRIEGIKANEIGESEKTIKFYGYIEEINVDFGSAEQDTLLTFETSEGRTFSYEGNNPNDFPVNPRHSANEGRITEISATEQQPLVRYVNAGDLRVSVSNAGERKAIKFVEIVVEE